ncbi:MAG TPA: FAD binding domain-containing protein [Kineosporiaceae bacterium]
MDLNSVTEVHCRASLPGWRPGDAWLAGGTWLFSEPQPDVTRLIDLTTLGWPALTVRPEGLEIAATCTIAELAALRCPPEWTAAPLIRQCCEAFLASFKIGSVATVGGNLCAALPAGPMISLAAALDGSCTIWAPDGRRRSISVAELVVGPHRTTLRPGELVRSVHLPAAALTARTAFRQVSLRPLGRSAALLVGRAEPGRLVLVVTAATKRPVALTLSPRPDSAQLRAALEGGVAPELYHDDVHGDPDWRQHLTLTLGEQVRAELVGREAG